MNAKKAKALRKLVRSFTGKLAEHHFKEMGSNTQMVEDGIAVETMKQAIKAEYGVNKK